MLVLVESLNDVLALLESLSLVDVDALSDVDVLVVESETLVLDESLTDVLAESLTLVDVDALVDPEKTYLLSHLMTYLYYLSRSRSLLMWTHCQMSMCSLSLKDSC